MKCFDVKGSTSVLGCLPGASGLCVLASEMLHAVACLDYKKKKVMSHVSLSENEMHTAPLKQSFTG